MLLSLLYSYFLGDAPPTEHSCQNYTRIRGQMRIKCHRGQQKGGALSPAELRLSAAVRGVLNMGLEARPRDDGSIEGPAGHAPRVGGVAEGIDRA